MARKRPTQLLAGVVALLAVALPATSSPAEALSFSDLPFMTDVFGDTHNIPITESELASVGCVVAGAGVAIATVVFGGTAVVATGGAGAGTATLVAVPVIAGAAAAGCAVGSAAAPGLAWFTRNADKLSHRVGVRVESMGEAVGNALPVPPLPPLPGFK